MPVNSKVATYSDERDCIECAACVRVCVACIIRDCGEAKHIIWNLCDSYVLLSLMLKASNNNNSSQVQMFSSSLIELIYSDSIYFH